MDVGTPPSPVPPGQPAPIAPSASGWPVVIGVITIVFGSLAALGACFGVAVLAFIDSLQELVDSAGGAAGPTGMEGLVEWRPWLLPLAGVAMLLGVLLLVGGIALLRRRPAAFAVLITWAVLKMAYVVANAYVGYRVNAAQFEAMQEDPNIPVFFGGMFSALGAAGAMFGALWGWALPVFLLIWFARAKIRSEVRAWA